MARCGDKRLRGYAEIGASSLILGTAATLIQVSAMPASLLVVTRMGLAGAVLAVFFFLTGGPAEARRNGTVGRLWRSAWRWPSRCCSATSQSASRT